MAASSPLTSSVLIPVKLAIPFAPRGEDSQDSSTVWAKANASVVVDPTAVPWVLLEVVGKEVGPTGGATLFGSTFIQRVNTVGGIAPTTGCDTATDLGAKAFMPYTADYVFYKKNSPGIGKGVETEVTEDTEQALTRRHEDTELRTQRFPRAPVSPC